MVVYKIKFSLLAIIYVNFSTSSFVVITNIFELILLINDLMSNLVSIGIILIV